MRCGTPLALPEGDTMLRASTLLIVLVLAGGPVGALACELWCNSPAGEHHHRAVGCHGAFQSVSEAQQIAPYATGCLDAAAVAPFVTEARPTESRSIAAAPVAFFDASSIGPDHDGTTTGWCVCSAPPPRPPSSRLVLRV